MRLTRCTACLAVPLLALLAGCGSDAPEPSLPPPETVARTMESDETELRALKTIPHVPVQGITGPNGTAFFVKERHPSIGQFPCSACHAGIDPIQRSPAASPAHRRMHVDIQLKHAPADSMDCTTCHAPGDPGQLQKLNGDPVSIDHAYQVCTQCHFEQTRDWAGGAHGKRLGGWRGKRVVNSCTECHNPHSPGFEQRLPDPGPLFPTLPGSHHE